MFFYGFLQSGLCLQSTSSQDLFVKMLFWQYTWIMDFEFTWKSNVDINFSSKILNSHMEI